YEYVYIRTPCHHFQLSQICLFKNACLCDGLLTQSKNMFHHLPTPHSSSIITLSLSDDTSLSNPLQNDSTSDSRRISINCRIHFCFESANFRQHKPQERIRPEKQPDEDQTGPHTYYPTRHTYRPLQSWSTMPRTYSLFSNTIP